MGSRAVALVCRDLEAARARFGAPDGGLGAVWTRTGRSFFTPELTDRLVDRLRRACAEAGLFDELDTSWVLLDAELLPWSVKAEGLLRDQYASVGAAARASLPVAVSASGAGRAAGVDLGDLVDRTRSRLATPKHSPGPTGATSGRPGAGRRTGGSVPGAGHRRGRPSRSPARVASGLGGSAGRRRSGVDHGHPTGVRRHPVTRGRPRRPPGGRSWSRAVVRGWW